MMENIREEKNNEMDFGSVVILHQLRSALTAIKWSLNMMLNGDFGKINAEQEKILEKAIEKNETLIFSKKLNPFTLFVQFSKKFDEK